MVSSLLPPPPPPLLLPLSPPPHAATSSAMAVTRQPETAVQRPRKVPPRRYGYNVRASYARRLMDRNGRTGAVAPTNVGPGYSRSIANLQLPRAPGRARRPPRSGERRGVGVLLSAAAVARQERQHRLHGGRDHHDQQRQQQRVHRLGPEPPQEHPEDRRGRAGEQNDHGASLLAQGGRQRADGLPHRRRRVLARVDGLRRRAHEP